jgi:hypothetical protein
LHTLWTAFEVAEPPPRQRGVGQTAGATGNDPPRSESPE